MNTLIECYYQRFKVGWARERWTSSFFTKTLPAMILEKHLSTKGKIWLPNLQCIEESLTEFKEEIVKYYDIKLIADAMENPLYAASENCERELLLCPDNLTNETQMKPLLSHSSHPFYVLEPKKAESGYWTDPESAVIGSTSLQTPTKKRKTRR